MVYSVCVCFLHLGHISITVMIISTPLGAAHSYLETSLLIFFFLIELYAPR